MQSCLELPCNFSVISETEYYLVTWKSVKKVLNVERVSDPEGTQLIGKRFSFRELNAAIAFKRTKSGVETDELYKFDEEVTDWFQFFKIQGKIKVLGT